MLPLKPDQVPTAKTSDKAAAGSSVKIQTVALHIEGMTCEMCVGKVQNALLAVPGVGRVTVDLKGKSSVVSAKGGEVVATSALIAGVEAAGFKASLATK
jgi:copper chaperone CopZ